MAKRKLLVDEEHEVVHHFEIILTESCSLFLFLLWLDGGPSLSFFASVLGKMCAFIACVPLKYGKRICVCVCVCVCSRACVCVRARARCKACILSFSESTLY
jgi:hypothetical protein